LLQLRHAWQSECQYNEGTASSNLCTEEPAAFRTRLRGHVAAVREWNLGAADIGALAAHDVRFVTSEPIVLASRLAVLAAFVMLCSSQPADSTGNMCTDRNIAVGKQFRDVLVRGHYRALYMSAAGLEQLVANYVRLGLFAAERAVREGCLRNPKLLRTVSWRVMVRKLAAVRAVGGSPEDELAAATCTCSAERVLEAGMLRKYSGCGPACTVHSTGLHRNGCMHLSRVPSAEVESC
jgi:hypothetical protein